MTKRPKAILRETVKHELDEEDREIRDALMRNDVEALLT
jgi:hypothetical protein